jgi:hypothetical protein
LGTQRNLDTEAGWPDEFVKKLPKMYPNQFFVKI